MSLHLRLGFVLLLLATIVTLALLVLSPRAPDPGGGTLSGETPPTRSRAMVRAVLDGATIELGSGERVHYLGILVPPPDDPNVPAFLAVAATEANRALVGGQSVYLESGGSATPEASDNPGSLDSTGQG
ncbi:MAG TPA: hypothetical protein VER55_06340, partial [Ardenticatenaceae bacterium]|nr:hypothetical protein [Ardenticatenaceae bacterium]